MTREYYLPPLEDRPVFAIDQNGVIFEVWNDLGGDGVLLTDGTSWKKVSIEELEKYERLEE
tara:strand:- start:397 stop:579 length:183 start_codon:yes stop_codon:yes gene_type:complete